MKFLNLTDTIVLLYDMDKAITSIEPRDISVDLSDDTINSSECIKRFLDKKIIKVYEGERIVKITKVVSQSQEVVHSEPDEKEKQAIYVEKQNDPIVSSPVDTIDRVNSIDKETSTTKIASVEDMGSIIETTKSKIPGSAKEVQIADKVLQATKKITKTAEDLIKEVEVEKQRKIDVSKLDVNFQLWLKSPYLKKKWEIIKCNDVAFLEKLVMYDNDKIKRLATERLNQIKNNVVSTK